MEELMVDDKQVTKAVTEANTEAKIVRESMDDFLDKLNWYKKRLDSLTDKTSDLNKLLIDYFNEHQTEDKYIEIKNPLNSLVRLGKKIISDFSDRKYKSGLKTSVENFSDEISYLKETLSDMELRYKSLPANKKLTSVLQELNKE